MGHGAARRLGTGGAEYGSRCGSEQGGHTVEGETVGWERLRMLIIEEGEPWTG